MSMHLAPAYLSTTRTGHKKKQNAKQARANEAHEKWLKSQGLHPEQLKTKKPKVKKDTVIKEINEHHKKYPSGNGVGNCPKKEENVYTGDLVQGIALLHKSCLQPVISKQFAEDVSKMRR